jgi:hypothetical protein
MLIAAEPSCGGRDRIPAHFANNVCSPSGILPIQQFRPIPVLYEVVPKRCDQSSRYMFALLMVILYSSTTKIMHFVAAAQLARSRRVINRVNNTFLIYISGYR